MLDARAYDEVVVSADGYLPIDYRLKTVRIGVQATWLTVVALIAYPFLPGAPTIDKTLYFVIAAIAAAGAVVIHALPWERLFQSVWGLRFQYAWSLLDIALITALIAVTGGAESHLFLIYVLTTVFFATSYRPSVQFWMLMATFVGYAIALFATDTQGQLADVIVRSTVLAVITLMTSFLSRELIGQGERLKKETEDRLQAEENLEAARERQIQALQLNDEIVQGLSVAKMAMDLGDSNVSRQAVADTLEAAKGIVSDLLDEEATLSAEPPVGLVKNL